MSRLLGGALAVVLAIACASCHVNDYCISCATGDGGTTDGGDGDAHDAPDAPDASTCVQTNGGVEICDGIDNDCNGTIDDNVSELGMACNNAGRVAQPGDPALTGACVGSKVVGCNSATQHVICDHPPMPEVCDLVDNNCDGQKDEGDPGGGVACGTNAGECTAGVMHCNKTTGVVECVGAIGTVGGNPEICDGKDNDCNGMIDDGLGALGTCGGPNVGLCHTGTLMCMGGGTICIGAQGPAFEACDGLDNDCDGTADEDYDKNTDPQNCNTCGHVCSAPNAVSGCSPGGCTIASCFNGFHDVNNPSPPLADADGCEYACQSNGAEVCDGVDNDCDGGTDNGLVPPAGLCNQVGECSGSVPVCTGASGWRCSYPSTVSVDASGNILPETTCDGLDNDCDGKTDENQPNLGAACHDSGIGECAGKGTFICDAANLDGPAVCNITTPGATPSPEQCDGKDNDCDGIVDNTTGANRVVDSMSHIVYGAFDFYMDTYEASRPDASASAEGFLGSRACSNPNKIPWGNVSWASAQAACQAAGKVLCTGTQWGAACAGAANTTYPYGNVFGKTTCNTESNDGIPGPPDDDVLLATGVMAACVAAQGPIDLSGNLREWTDDITGVTGTGKNIAVLRGGSYLTPAAGATCGFRTSRAAVDVLEDENGFRCCKATAP